MNETKDVPYIVHEGSMARAERTIKRLWILCILLVVLLVGSNAGWIWYESQFMDEVVTQEVDTTDGGDAIVNGTGELNYNGEGETNNQTETEENGR